MHSNKTKCFLKSFQMKETMRVVKKMRERVKENLAGNKS